MIEIEEIKVEDINTFFDMHINYLINDEIITDEEDIEYFKGDEYRSIIKHNMERNENKHHMIYFNEFNKYIGCCQYNTYQTIDGKCFILDFWIFEEYRNNYKGHECFKALEEYTKKDGAKYYEINCNKDDSLRFWKSLGFIENGLDEYDEPLYIKK